MIKMLAGILDVNQSVLSGAMDVIAVRQPDGSISSSAFHIRFGTFKILKTKDKIIDIYVNGEKTNLTMKLSSSGDAYFTHEKKKLNFNETEEENYIVVNNDNKQLKETKIELQQMNCSPDEDRTKVNDLNKTNEECLLALDEVNQENNVIEIPNFQIHNSPKDISNEKIVVPETLFMSKSIEISLCYSEIVKNPENAEEIFSKNLVKKEDFVKDPWKILNNSNLLICYAEKLYHYKAAIPILFSLLIYGEELPESSISDLNTEKGFLSYFKSKENKLSKIKISTQKTENVEEKINQNQNFKSPSPPTMRRNSITKTRCFTPTSEQLKCLNLKEGRNEISFVCKSRLSGKQVLTADVYLWDYTSRVVISDIDGTITKSDVLGQIMPMIGKDWSHEGVTDLFTNIARNGYKIIYLTARALCQSNTTKNFIQTLFKNHKGLPEGPILTSPDGIVSSFKREVIDKTPQTFKIACLTEVKRLFPKSFYPFHAGFGNRISDAVSYRTVGIALSNIFIINEKGEVIQLNNSVKKTYTLLNEIIDSLFSVEDSITNFYLNSK